MNFKKPNSSGAPKPDIYEMVTTRILEKLEQGQIPWQKPWDIKTGSPANIVTGKPYNGINIMLLGSQSYDSKYWLTFKQCLDKGGNVRKGEKGSIVVFWNFIDKNSGKSIESDSDKSSAKSSDVIPMLKYYTVFNVNQCESLDLMRLREEVEAQSQGQNHDEILSAQTIIDQYKDCPEIKYGFTKACYKPHDDVINMPKPEHFKTKEEFFSTLFHEAIHSSGHESRLNRKNSSEVRSFGDEAYSKEELVAEMGASFLCARAGIENTTIDNSAAYIQSWMKALQDDKKLLVTAAGQAQKAASYITKKLDDLKLGLNAEETVTPDDIVIQPSKSASLSLLPITPVPETIAKEKVDSEKEDPVKRRLREFGYTAETLEKVFSLLKESSKSSQISDYIKSGIISSSADLEDMLRVSKNVGSTAKKKSHFV